MESITKHLYLRRMTKNLKNEDKQIRNQFLSVLSHELKLPLSAIEGYLRIMKEKLAGDTIEAYEEMINRSLERIKGMRLLITDLLDLTKIESDKRDKDLKRLNITDIAAVSKEIISPMASQKNVEIYIDSEPEQIFFTGDPEKIEIIFNNLISNAVKYNKDNGEVRCTLRDYPDSISIVINDTGIGMSEEDIPKLFQEFVRLKNDKTRKISGSGLGLSITRKIVEEFYNGKISLTSVPDEGTTFTIELPKRNLQ
jgi:signal transduction histidine kinase